MVRMVSSKVKHSERNGGTNSIIVLRQKWRGMEEANGQDASQMKSQRRAERLLFSNSSGCGVSREEDEDEAVKDLY